MQWVVINWDLP